jgi:hypothetical protein
MPRDIVIVSPSAPTMAAVAKAARLVGPDLAVHGGADGQGVHVHDEDRGTVLSLAASAPVHNLAELDRLAPLTAPVQAEEVWWTEAWAPWGPDGDAGVAVARKLATGLRGSCMIEDGL